METIGEKRWNSWSKRNLGLETRFLYDKLSAESAEIEVPYLRGTATRPRSFPPSFLPPLTLLPSRNLVETAADSSVRPLVSSFADVTGSLSDDARFDSRAGGGGGGLVVYSAQGWKNISRVSETRKAERDEEGEKPPLRASTNSFVNSFVNFVR